MKKLSFANLGFLHDAVQVLHAEGNIFHTVAMAATRGDSEDNVNMLINVVVILKLSL
jgi:hypothetical protein